MGTAAVHSSEIFAMPWEMLFDGARRQALGDNTPMEVPLWSGLRLHALPQAPGHEMDSNTAGRTAGGRLPLKDLETALIRKAVDDARGNVMQAARALGISRATVYRKLGNARGSK